MGYNEPDVYYQPEKFDLEIVKQVGEQDYSYDLVVVWRHKETGQHYIAHDSGCSCFPPFEDYTDLDQLATVNSKYDIQQFVKSAAPNSLRASDLIDLLSAVDIP